MPNLSYGTPGSDCGHMVGPSNRRERGKRVEDFRILDHITDGVMALDQECEFQNINRTAARLLKRGSDEDLLSRETIGAPPVTASASL